MTLYLEALEKCLKEKSGVVPEDALSDARSHLERYCQDLNDEETKLDDAELFDRLVRAFGEPEVVAAQYESEAGPLPMSLPGYAPTWRICCTKCGRSVPASKVGAFRVGAKSFHKYVLGWCSGCRWLRWLRLQRDLGSENLTGILGSDVTPEQLRSTINLPVWKIVALVLACVGLLNIAMYFWLR